MENTALGGEKCLKRGFSEAIVKVVFLFFSVFCFFKIFINIDWRGGGLALPWSLEKLPVKSSAVNCLNTFSQDCRLKGSKKLAHAQTKCLEQQIMGDTGLRSWIVHTKTIMRRKGKYKFWF